MTEQAIRRYEVLQLLGLRGLVTGKQLYEAALYAQQVSLLEDLKAVLTDDELAVGKRYQRHFVLYGIEPKRSEFLSLSCMTEQDYELWKS